MAQIETFEFNPQGFEEVHKYHYGCDWPVVYLLETTNEAYVGETTNFFNRSRQHYENDERRRLKKAHIITDETYNKSAALDIEAFLIEHLAAEGSLMLQNKNDGIRNHNYYQRSEYRAKCEIIWKELIKKGLIRKEIYEIENSDLFKYSPYKALTEEQYIFVKKLVKDIENEKATTYVVEGVAGTGKTILATYLIKYLKDHESTKHLKIALIAPMTSLRGTLQKVFKATPGLKSNMVIGPYDITNESYDLVIVDEAHRLKKRKNLGAAFKAFDEINKQLGLSREATQLDWILKNTKRQVFFYDQGQSVLPADIDDVDLRQKGASFYQLTKQMRIQAGEDYILFIDDTLNQRKAKFPDLKNYELSIFDDVSEMHKAIKEKDKKLGLSRMVAGFAWPWVTNPANGVPEQDFDIEIKGHKFRWNSKTKDWVNSPNAVNEVGCIHTVQGYGMNYVGVIVGPELTYDKDENKIVVDKSKYCDRNGHAGVADPKELERYIINIYRTLLTRGIKGTYIYIVDDNLREYFKKIINNKTIPTSSPERIKEEIASPYTFEMVKVPVFESVGCGELMYADPTVQEMISVRKDYMSSGSKYFVLRVSGDSMNKAGINDGDLVLCVKNYRPEEGKKVVALIGDDATIKEYRRENGLIVLYPRSDNSKHQPLKFKSNEEIQMQGVVIKVLNNNDVQ
ncbi:MAG: DNA/RNA helicase domain-containing protein [Candidatus Paceibacterota bacterium]